MNSSLKTHLLIAVPTFASLLVGAATVVLYLYFFPPHFRGWGEVTARPGVAGWAVNSSSPTSRVEVQLYVDGRFIALSVAELARPDVVAAGWTTDERCGYDFLLPPLPAGEHEARVYAVHEVGGSSYRMLQMLGAPLHFKTDAGGNIITSARLFE